jgi:hypothetical protein
MEQERKAYKLIYACVHLFAKSRLCTKMHKKGVNSEDDDSWAILQEVSSHAKFKLKQCLSCPCP